MAQPDVVAGEVPGGGRQVVGGDRCQAVLAPPLRRERTTATVVVELEPQHGRAEQAAFAQVVAHPGFDRAEVFADDDRTCPSRFERQDPDRGVVVVADVGALGRARTGRDPPQPEQPDHVVDAYPAGMTQGVRDQLAERRVAEFGEPIGSQRRLIPVLPGLCVRVGWCADGHAARELVLPRPRVGADRAHADGEVVHDAEAHAVATGGRLRVGELFVDEPLQPPMEVDLGRMRRPRMRPLPGSAGAAARPASRASRRRALPRSHTRPRNR